MVMAVLNQSLFVAVAAGKKCNQLLPGRARGRVQWKIRDQPPEKTDFVAQICFMLSHFEEMLRRVRGNSHESSHIQTSEFAVGSHGVLMHLPSENPIHK